MSRFLPGIKPRVVSDTEILIRLRVPKAKRRPAWRRFVAEARVRLVAFGAPTLPSLCMREHVVLWGHTLVRYEQGAYVYVTNNNPYIHSTSSASSDKDGGLLSLSATLVVFRASSAIGRHARTCAEAPWSAAHLSMIVAGSEHELPYMSVV